MDEEGGLDEIDALIAGHLLVGILDYDDVAGKVGVANHVPFGDTFVFLNNVLDGGTSEGQSEVVRIVRRRGGLWSGGTRDAWGSTRNG